MKESDVQEYIERYEGRLRDFGYDPQTLGWGKEGKQDVRFAILGREILANPDSSVLDVGCGFGDFHHFLRAHGWSGRYTGLDIVPGLIETGRKLAGDIDLRLIDVTAAEPHGLGSYDYVVASGIMNARLSNDDNRAHIRRMLAIMYELADVAAMADFMTSYVDFQKEGAWHSDPSWVLGEAMKMTRRVRLEHDYMPFEFAVFLYKNAAKSPRNVYQAHEEQIRTNGLTRWKPSQSRN